LKNVVKPRDTCVGVCDDVRTHVHSLGVFSAVLRYVSEGAREREIVRVRVCACVRVCVHVCFQVRQQVGLFVDLFCKSFFMCPDDDSRCGSLLLARRSECRSLLLAFARHLHV